MKKIHNIQNNKALARHLNRLISGHLGLKKYHDKINQKDSPNCSTAIPQKIKRTSY